AKNVGVMHLDCGGTERELSGRWVPAGVGGQLPGGTDCPEIPVGARGTGDARRRAAGARDSRGAGNGGRRSAWSWHSRGPGNCRWRSTSAVVASGAGVRDRKDGVVARDR